MGARFGIARMQGMQAKNKHRDDGIARKLRLGWRDFVIVFGIFKNRTHIRLHFVKNKSFQFQFAFSTKVVTNIHLFLAVHSWDKNENQKQRRQSHQLHFFWWVSWEKKEMVELPPLHVSLSFVTVNLTCYDKCMYKSRYYLTLLFIQNISQFLMG